MNGLRKSSGRISHDRQPKKERKKTIQKKNVVGKEKISKKEIEINEKRRREKRETFLKRKAKLVSRDKGGGKLSPVEKGLPEVPGVWKPKN